MAVYSSAGGIRCCGGKGLCLTACCPSERKQTSDYIIITNLNASQCGAWLSQSGAWGEEEHGAAYFSFPLTWCPHMVGTKSIISPICLTYQPTSVFTFNLPVLKLEVETGSRSNWSYNLHCYQQAKLTFFFFKLCKLLVCLVMFEDALIGLVTASLGLKSNSRKFQLGLLQEGHLS